jgi:hypothetical protein
VRYRQGLSDRHVPGQQRGAPHAETPGSSQGRAVDFNAIDIQRLANREKITEDWHLEDTPAVPRQAGLVTAAGPK